MFFWNDPTEDPNDPQARPAGFGGKTAWDLGANRVLANAGRGLLGVTPPPAPTPPLFQAIDRMNTAPVAAAPEPIRPALGRLDAAALAGLTPAAAAERMPAPPPSTANLARNLAAPTPATPAAAGGMLGGSLGGIAKDGPPPYIDGGTAPTYSGGPGAGWGRNSHPSDYEYTARAGIPPAPHVWTEADLEPTSVLGYTGSLRKAFSGGDTYGYTAASPNLPIFRADQASRAQALNFAAEMANSIGRMNFQASENEKDRKLKRELDLANNDAKKNQALNLLANPAVPQDIKDIQTRDSVSKGVITPAEAASLKMTDLLEKARLAAGTSDIASAASNPAFWEHLAANFDPKTMSKATLISRLIEKNVKPSDVSLFANPWGSFTSGTMYGLGKLSGNETPLRKNARGLAGSLLNP